MNSLLKLRVTHCDDFVAAASQLHLKSHYRLARMPLQNHRISQCKIFPNKKSSLIRQITFNNEVFVNGDFSIKHINLGLEVVGIKPLGQI